MKAPWEYLENLCEIVYVTDAQTSGLVYMNRYAMEKFALRSAEDYRGQKCYTLLQGRSSPCDSCSDSAPNTRRLTSWSYYNPVLGCSLIRNDTPILWNGRQYRMTVAAAERQTAPDCMYLRYDTLLNECLRESRAAKDPEESIRSILRFMGEQMRCRRVDLYERLPDGGVQHSFSWQELCAAPALSEPTSSAAVWEQYEALCCGQPLLISDAGKFRSDAPALARFLEVRTKQPFLLLPLAQNDSDIGLLRLDMPCADSPVDVTSIARLLAYFIAALLRQRDMTNQLEHLSYHDQLTGARNRYALEEHIAALSSDQPIGVIMCDVIGLKQVNDIQGHASGDRLIHRVYDSLASVFSAEDIYRMGGDEFLVLCHEENEGQLEIRVDLLRRQLRSNNCGLSIGAAWAGAGAKNVRALIKLADDRMYQEKQAFYAQSDMVSGRLHHGCPDAALSQRSTRDPFLEFIRKYYFDSHSFFESVMPEDAPVYYYCGDMQRNVYYISDHLKQDFNFDDNLVVDFVGLLEQRIMEADRERHMADQQTMLAEKNSYHSIYYRIYDRNSQPIWMHCQGILQWNEDKSVPLFFSGIMTPTDPNHHTNPVLNSRQLSLAIESVRSGKDAPPMMFCVALNGFETINYLFGRRRGDSLIWEVINQLQSGLGERFKLIRLEGTHLAALTCAPDDVPQVCRRIRQIVKEVYARNQIPLLYPCSIGVMPSLRPNITAQELLVKTSSVLRTAKSMPEVEYTEFTPEMSSNYRYAVNLSVALNRCVNHQFSGFRMVVQPQVHSESGKLFGGEALLRWRYEGIDIPASEFIPILERTELIIPVGKWVVSQVAQICQQACAIMPDFHLSFNVSYHQIMDSSFFPFIRREMEGRRIDGQRIFIELTETHFDESPALLDQFLVQCRSAGYHFALDDFGSAYSNFQLLLQHPADLVKLDRSLIQEIATSQDKFNFIMSIIYACHKFKKLVCVEGVETAEELAAVRRTECDYIQGFYFYHPLELDALYPLLREAVSDPAPNEQQKSPE